MKSDSLHPFRIAMAQVWRKRFSLQQCTASSFAQSMSYVPLAALLLGLTLTGLAWMLSDLPAEIVSALLLMLWIGLTGSHNLAALAQVTEVLVQRDAASITQLTASDQTGRCLGATGLVLMVLAILLKWALLVRVISEGWWLVLALMPLVGWTFGQMVMLGSRWVDEHQLPENWRQSVSVSWLWPQWLLLLTALALASGWTLTVLIIATWAWIVWWRKQLRGINLAVALSWVEMTELTWLIGLVLVMMP